ncbi:MAG TPA: MarR family winged helix-turn-helix transcriptional regulator [Paracoccaceae bacterium]|nr:MarR family winged helix-turn-helix transcriptional regulator [Paracoccaceae bacterium]
MSISAAIAPTPSEDGAFELYAGYLEMLALVERLHRLLLDVIKSEFDRTGRVDLNPVQALLLFNIGTKVVTAGELKSRGYYQGSNVSYNLKKLIDLGYIDHQRCQMDRRSVRVRLTGTGVEVHRLVSGLFQRHAAELGGTDLLRTRGIEEMNRDLRSIERYWTDEIRQLR